METLSIDAIVVNEFSGHYQGDVLPHPSRLDPLLPRMARHSALRLRREISDEQMPALVERLLELRDDRSHPLHADIMNRTEIYWPDVPQMWDQFHRLIDMIVDELGKLPARGQ